MSRKSVERGQITLHPGGIPHGPHPGTVEKSIGKESTDELAVMIDPFHPLMITEEALKIEDPDYRSAEHTSELQSLMRISYAVFCLHIKKILTAELLLTYIT